MKIIDLLLDNIFETPDSTSFRVCFPMSVGCTGGCTGGASDRAKVSHRLHAADPAEPPPDTRADRLAVQLIIASQTMSGIEHFRCDWHDTERMHVFGHPLHTMNLKAR